MSNIKTHQEIGTELNLFFFDEISPGSCFFLPNGATIYNNLVEFLRVHYKKLGYQEIITPNLYNKKLWEISGHWDKYKENMFLINKKSIDTETDEDEFSLKPMNCPGHCQMFKHITVSYRDLPIRWADFGVLHRNELSGSLRGLTRVRRFQQDDAHIFCSLDQVDKEIADNLSFLQGVYIHFGFKFTAELSTRPKEYIGNLENWNKAEAILENQIKKLKHWKINPGDGAFYGPKIDIHIKDSLKRTHQCGTLQLDFNLPERFDLKYSDEQGLSRPVLIHRAILGSVERFMAILLEHTNGKLPFWLSPRQICIIPVSNNFLDYCLNIKSQLKEYRVEIDDSNNTLNKKIRNAEKFKFNYILVVGEREVQNNTVNLRIKKIGLGEKSISEIKSLFSNDLNKMNDLT
ncbi:tRNA synthetase class II core domain (G, H, P, S and T) [seawater metagenome]|uniref:threonine--tRNA ligase n=1 Tax=seawater metagenome TaxID=1561972 RepID=A0A5E8CKV3_9ZZZZ